MIKLVVFDFDGVFTNGSVTFDNNGNIQKSYNVKDGMGIKKLLQSNINIGVISGYIENKSQNKILEHLNIKYKSFENNNKFKTIKKWASELEISLDEVAFMGDDINDIEVFEKINITGCPKDANKKCIEKSSYLSEYNGGNGCIRDFSEYIIKNNLKNDIVDYKNGKITAVIAVRKGSIRCKNKNTKPFGDSNLLTLKIKMLKQVEEINEIIVTTDCEISKLIGKHMNVNVVNRPSFYCSDECSGNEMLKYIASQCSNTHILYSPVTSPFFSSKFIKNIIKKYRNLKNNDSIVTKSNIKEFIWNNKRPLNYDIDNFPRSQDLTDDIFYLNFGCCILPKNVMIERKYIVGYKPFFVKNSDEYSSIDIDTPVDFEIANKIYNSNYKKNIETNFIDVTIRDGGFSNNWNWSINEVISLYNLFSSLGYKYFEIGYFINENLKEPNSGLWRNLPYDILKKIPINNSCQISAMIDFWKYDIEKLKPQSVTNISLIRITSYKEDINSALKYCKKVKKLGYKVSLNLIVCSWMSDEDVINIITEILKEENFLDYICLADSYGNLSHNKCKHILKLFSSYLNCLNVPIGFHIHDTGGLGLSNAILSVDNNINYLDTTLFGIGRGSGNLSCNNILIYLKSKNKININLKILLTYIDINYSDKINDIHCLLQGFYNIHPTTYNLIKKNKTLVQSYESIIKLTDKEKYHYKNFNNDKNNEISNDNNDNNNDDEIIMYSSESNKSSIIKYDVKYSSSTITKNAELGTIEKDVCGFYGSFKNEELRGEKIIEKMLEEKFDTILDIGAGELKHTNIFIQKNKIVDICDFGNSIYFKKSKINADKIRNKYFGDFNSIIFKNKYDAIWCSHILEHQLNVNLFLKKINSLLKDNGVLCIIVPPRKPHIVGGHVTLWNAGLLLYNLILAGFDCSNYCKILQYDYNIGIIIKKKKINENILKLTMDRGDIELLSKYFPFDVKHNFNGDILKYNW